MRRGQIKKLQAHMAEEDIEQLLVTESANLEYLTGIRKCSGVMVVAADDWQLYLPKFFRYSVTDVSRVSVFGSYEELLETVDHRHDDIQYADRPNTVTFECEPSDIVMEARLTKTDQEQKWIREACQIATDAFGEARELFAPGLTEWEIATTIDAQFGAAAVDNAFETLAHAGTTEPHRPNQDTQVTEGELLLVDLGCIVQGYCSDMTRLVPNRYTDEQKDLAETVVSIQETVLDRVEAGTPVADLASLAQDRVDHHGFDVDDHFLHALGHGVGLEVHEAPRIGPNEETILQEGMVLALEPGLYVPGVGGARTEDQIIVTDDGFERLTPAPKWHE